MKVVNRFPSQHDDFIHDVAYDFYGKRLATCSSDRTIKIWEQVYNGGWVLQASWKAHTSSVWQLAWANPVFGQVLASCSYDRTVTIWEEQEGILSWKQKAQLVDSKESVNTIEFAPRHLGLKLATGSSDGYVRVYEAGDVLNLSHWQLQDNSGASNHTSSTSGGVTCLSWCTAGISPPCIWVHNAEIKRWQPALQLTGHSAGVNDISWAPSMGRSFYFIATASKDESLAEDESFGQVWRVEWNVTGTMLASSGDDGRVRLWKQSPKGDWRCCDKITAGEQQV
eukprot:GSMAST32.ASY1.ANO1.614.1 assembled CDS